MIDVDAQFRSGMHPPIQEKRMRKLIEEEKPDEETCLELEIELARQYFQWQMPEMQERGEAIFKSVSSRRSSTMLRAKARYLSLQAHLSSREVRANYYEAAWKEACKTDNEYLQFRTGYDYWHQFLEPQSLVFGKQFVDSCRKATCPKVREYYWVISQYLAELYDNENRLEEALIYYRESLQALPEGASWWRTSELLIAQTLRQLKRYEQAWEIYPKLLKTFQSENHSPQSISFRGCNGGSDGYLLEEVGYCLEAMGRLQEAKDYFSRAYQMLSASGCSGPDHLKTLKAKARSL